MQSTSFSANFEIMAITVLGRGFVCRMSYVKSYREWLFHT